MFMSEYNHTLDTKGRLIIPAKFREVLGEEFVVSKGMDGCLFVYANDDWNAFEQKLTSLPLINKEARQFARFFLAGAATVEVDKQGRILLPAALTRVRWTGKGRGTGRRRQPCGDLEQG